MIWQKKGLIFNVDGQHNWNRTHAQLPIVDINYKDKWRIYYATRNLNGKSNIGYFDVEKNNPSTILFKSETPLLNYGGYDSFDENGIMPVAIVENEGEKFLYYTGWNTRKDVPYYNTIGLAISEDNGNTFKKNGDNAIFESTSIEPYSNGTVNVIVENGIWKAWYQSITKWQIIQGRLEPFYHIKYAESTNGIDWQRKGTVAIDFKSPTEGGIASASVLKEDSIYKMWYSYRKALNYRTNKLCSYKIGYAESKNGVNWKRLDDIVGIELSSSGWDSEMMAYPNVFKYNGKKYMFYNGNGFGKSGIGYAISH